MDADGQRWYERLGVQINHPPPEERSDAESYERPPMWLAAVAPGSWTSTAQFGVFLVLFGVLTGIGIDAAFWIALFAGFAALYAADGWWRRTHRPSEDAPRHWLWRRRGRSG